MITAIWLGPVSQGFRTFRTPFYRDVHLAVADTVAENSLKDGILVLTDPYGERYVYTVNPHGAFKLLPERGMTGLEMLEWERLKPEEAR